VLFLIPYLLTLIALIEMHPRQRDRMGRLGRVGYRASEGAMIAVLIGQAGIIADVEALTWLSFPIGAVVWFAGFALYGIATVRAKALPAWVGAAIALSQPLTAVAALALSPISPVADHGDFSGAVVHGLVWFAIGRTIFGRSTFIRPDDELRRVARSAHARS
jgi:hypothetical protein